MVEGGTSLQPILDASPAGAVLWLAPGTYAGPVRITKALTLWGPAAAVVRSGGSGTTVQVLSDSVALLGFSVDGSGRRADLLDGAVFVRGSDVRVEGLHIRDALFGISVEKSARVRVVDNEIIGTPEDEVGLRGDAVRFWETRDSLIEGNRVSHSRDMVVWYSPRNRVLRNMAVGGRYGTHFMYSHDSEVRGNRYLGNLVGVFIMYSRNVAVADNLMALSDPTGGLGLGIKESGNLTVTGNRFVRNQSGVYLDTSPLQRGDSNVFARNTFAFCEAGVAFHSSESRNAFRENDFTGNRMPVRVEGGGDATGVAWERNYFDDYQGYDLDGDGTGDVPYEARSLSGQLASAHEELAFFRGTPALGLLDAASRFLPLLTPKLLFADAAPRMSPRAAREAPGAR